MQPDLPPLDGVTHRHVDVGGVNLHVAEAGDGPPLVLLHGWPQHWWEWRHLMPRLAERYRVIAPDLRGWGWSDAPPGDYAKDTFRSDVIALLDAEGIDRVRLIGHDFGGYTGFLLALRNPDRIERFVALDIPPPWRTRPRLSQVALPAFLTYQFVAAAPGLGTAIMERNGRFVRTVIRAGSGPAMSWTPEELDAYAQVLRVPARAAASSACYRTFLTREIAATTPLGPRGGLDVPTLLLMGEQSWLRRLLEPPPGPNLRVETVPGAGHFLPEEAPDEVLAAAVPFLAAS